MDPVTAVANALEAIAKMVTVIVEGQTPEQKAKIWEWYVKDTEWWRKVLHIDGDHQ